MGKYLYKDFVMTEISTVITSKVAAMIGGLFGGAAILTFIKPKTIGEAFLRGSLSTGSATIFTGPAVHYLNLDHNWENELMSGFVIGFLAYSVLGMVANFLKKNQHKDIVEAVKDIKK
jgi:hypothetical protein